MSRDLLYPRRVRWSEWLSAIHAPPPASPPPISAGEKQRCRLCTTAAGLACLGLIVKFFVPHSGPFYRLVPGEGGAGRAAAAAEAEGVADKQRRGRGIGGKILERAAAFNPSAHSRGFLSNFYAVAHA